MADYSFPAGMQPTGRLLKDPASELHELDQDEGIRHLAIWFRDPYRDHPAINRAVELALPFLEYPMVTGLVELSDYDIDDSVFIYPTGMVWTIKEILRRYREIGQKVGLRAALELCYLAGIILKEASETGPLQGVYSHGGLSPWRIALKMTGEVQIIGYGLPQVELHQWRDDEETVLDADSIRYAPPERLEGGDEDLAADLYALVLIAVELVTGKPLFDGRTDDMIERIKLAEGPQLLLKLKKQLPKPVLDYFCTVLIYDPDRRPEGQDFLDEIVELIDNVEGDGLVEIMGRMRGKGGGAKSSSRRPARKVQTVSTSTFSTSELAEMAAAAKEEEEAKKAETRWGKSKRGRKKEDEAPAEEEAAPAAEEEKPARRRRRRKADEEEPAAEAAPAEEEDKPKRRRRRRKADEEEAAAEAAPAEEEEAPKRRRRRRKADDEEPAAEAAPAEEEEAPKRRRRRRKADDEEEAAAAPAEEEEKPTRRRRRRKADEEEAPAADEEEAPKPRRRRRRKAEEDEAPAEEEKPARRRRRRKADEDEAPAEEEAAPRRRRRRKADDDADEPAPRRRRRRKADDE